MGTTSMNFNIQKQSYREKKLYLLVLIEMLGFIVAFNLT